MTRHLLKLVWNRKKTTLLVMIEIAAAFLVLSFVSIFAVQAIDNWRRPLGFTWTDVWSIEVDRRAGGVDGRVFAEQVEEQRGPGQPPGSGPATPAPRAGAPRPAGGEGGASGGGEGDRLRQLLIALREFAEVEAVATSGVAPFEMGGMIEAREVNGRRLDFGVNEVSDSYAGLLGLRLTRGRWFGPEDNGQPYDAVVITEDFVAHWFGDRDPVGQPLVELDAEDLQRGARPQRVVGVVEAYREDGEFDGARNFALYRSDLEAGVVRRDRLSRHLLIRVRPDTPAAFEERLVRRLQAAAPDWSFEVRTLASLRDTQTRFTVAPLAAIGVVAGSLLLMVALGLIGVLWQSVTQRTREIGLRRAKGATRDRIRRQILGEILVMTTLAVAAPTLLLAQLPLLDPLDWQRPGVYVAALAVSLAAIYVLAMCCGWYPARLATAVEPSEALRYE